MYLPNTTGELSKKGGKNLYSEISYSAPITVECAIVHLKGISGRTSVRTDSSATRGNAEERQAAAKILFGIDVPIEIGDKFQINGLTLRAVAKEHRNDVPGNHDHNEVDFEILT